MIVAVLGITTTILSFWILLTAGAFTGGNQNIRTYSVGLTIVLALTLIVALGTLLHGNRALYAANSPRSYLPRLHFQHPMQFFVDVGGASGRGIVTVRTLARQLQRRGERTQFRVEPGQAHTWTEASVGLPYALAFAFPTVQPLGPATGPPTGHA